MVTGYASVTVEDTFKLYGRISMPTGLDITFQSQVERVFSLSFKAFSLHVFSISKYQSHFSDNTFSFFFKF